MKIGSQAMNAALTDFQALGYSTRVVSAYESYLTAKWLEGQKMPTPPDIAQVNQAVAALFEVAPGHQLGRLYPFRYDWKEVRFSGRRTVWNNTTRSRTSRGQTLAASLFVGDDFRSGLRPDAATILAQALPTDNGTPRRPSKQSLISLILRDHDFDQTDGWPDAEGVLLTHLAMPPADLAAIASPDPLGVPLFGPEPWSIAAIPATLGPQSTIRVRAATADTSVPSPAPVPEVTVVIEQRVERMLRRALARYPCVLLVGPPGTGKGTLIRWLTREAQADAAAFGLRPGIRPNPLWRTPDESWTAFELIGGLTPDSSGELTWSPGIAMNCIRDDRWLVLDETNRADMDKIMGPLLTWLSEQEVEIARTAPSNGKPIHLGWADSPNSRVTGADGAQGPVRYLAGKDWRLLGTYNPQDAQRVFRFGQALSRRFVVVPVPALRPGQFTELLGASYPDLPDDVATAITGIYAAHQSDRATSLGPAVFLRLAQYVQQPASSAGERQPAMGSAPQAGSGAAQGTLDPVQPRTGPAAGGQPPDDQLLAEAYVLSVSKYLAGFDDPVIAALGTRIVDDEGALPQEQWEWVLAQRDILG